MPNIANVLRSEMSRLARKEVRAETDTLRKLLSKHRSMLAELKRQVQALEQQARRIQKSGATETGAAESEPAGTQSRFSAKGLAGQRRRLGLTAADVGQLLGTSSQTIYNWEQGTARPRSKYMPSIAALKSLSKKTARAHLDAMKPAS